MKYEFNLYAALDLDKDASQEEIKKSYRQLALQLHPDKRMSNLSLEDKLMDEAMCGINEAFSVLSDLQKRIRYDHETKYLRLKKPAFYEVIRRIRRPLNPSIGYYAAGGVFINYGAKLNKKESLADFIRRQKDRIIGE